MKLLKFIAGICVIASALASNVSAATINFTQATFASRQTIYDTADVDVVFQSDLLLWGPGYNDLAETAYTAQGQSAIIDFIPLNGGVVTLKQFDMGNYANRNESTQYSIYSLDDLVTPLFSSGTFVVPFSTTEHPTYTVNLASSAGIRLVVGPDLWNTGIQNIVFESGSAVATPDGGASAVLLGIGMVGMAFLPRRK